LTKPDPLTVPVIVLMSAFGVPVNVNGSKPEKDTVKVIARLLLTDPVTTPVSPAAGAVQEPDRLVPLCDNVMTVATVPLVTGSDPRHSADRLLTVTFPLAVAESFESDTVTVAVNVPALGYV
jgi:hypothetical protein